MTYKNIKQFLLATGFLTGALSILLVMTLAVSPVVSGQLIHMEKQPQTMKVRLSAKATLLNAKRKLKNDATVE
ncbi:hypothetical protein [Marinicella sp. W31]|uniref:hypothetical protein n=1 Tax=Marinicella sp. W31 TaxID=3023713 RepID=UPI003756BB83